jgi:hypothetical protein
LALFRKDEFGDFLQGRRQFFERILDLFVFSFESINEKLKRDTTGCCCCGYNFVKLFLTVVVNVFGLIGGCRWLI